MFSAISAVTAAVCSATACAAAFLEAGACAGMAGWDTAALCTGAAS